MKNGRELGNLMLFKTAIYVDFLKAILFESTKLPMGNAGMSFKLVSNRFAFFLLFGTQVHRMAHKTHRRHRFR